MLYKKIDISSAIFSNIEQEAAEAFIDMRLSIKRPMTQRAFNQNIARAVQCENMGLCSATEAVDITSDKCWQSVSPEYIQSTQARQMSAIASSATSTKNTSLLEDLNSRDWAH